MTREHAMLLSCASAVFLFLSLSSKPIAINWASSKTNEAEIDAALQNAAAAALADREGTIIVMDAQTGRVRAIVNSQLAYEQALMPGSAIKPFTALAALRAGLIDESSRTVCPGRFTGLNFSLACVHKDHLPPFSPSQAIAYSCNYYFATAGQRLGRDQLVATLREFDFGQNGVLRPCEIGNSAQPDCRERAAVGESDHVQVTPIQLLTAYTALVNGGHLFKPQVTRSDHFQSVERSSIDIAAKHRAIIVDGMRGAIRYGTARAAKLDSLPLTIIGKTGTALPAKGFRDNGWFVGLAAPFQSSGELDASQINLAILVLLPRAHGSEAAALARPIFETYANQAGNETQISYTKSNDGVVARSTDAASPIKVHLVHDNVTQTLSLEDYVLGVMRAEGTVEPQPEALKALAIAIRSYALKNRARHAASGYDFCSTTHCQRFVDSNTTSNTLRDAVRATEGVVLIDEHGDPIDAYFGASCGGATANIRDLWGVTPAPYLRGVRDEYCDAGPHAKWTDTISRADLLRALQSDSRTDVGNRLDQVSISQRDETGRAEFITIEGERRKTVRGWDFKIIVGRILGWNVLRSSRFEIARSGSSFVFHGSGFGHGLGLCQEGAHVMAERGASYQKILEKYFPGTVVKRVTAESKADVLPGALSYRSSGRTKALCLQSQDPLLETVSTTCGSGWVRSCAATKLLNTGVKAAHPPATAGGTDCLQQNSRLLRQSRTSFKLLSISSDHFSLAYPADVDRRTVDQIMNTLESTRNDYLRRASSTSPNIPRLEIRLNESTGDFTARTGQPWWAAAATTGNRIELQPARILMQRGVLFTTLRHELAHILIDSISKRAPRWLEEGFALYLAGESQLISRYAARDRLSEDVLEQRLQHPRTQDEMRTLYAEAYLLVADMIRREGEPSVWNKISRY